MTLEGEYYSIFLEYRLKYVEVAILMTLEGEYYEAKITEMTSKIGRNPHDIGRRILPEYKP